MNQNSKISGIIISGGLSSRMGKSKALLTYKELPFILSISEKLKLICDEVIIVLGFGADQILESIEKCFIDDDQLRESLKFVINKKYEIGMFTSFKTGLKKSRLSEGYLLHQVDQPHLSEKFYFDLKLQFDPNSNWLQPSFNLQGGHPVIINNEMKSNILSANDNSSLREVVRNCNIKKSFWNCEYSEVLEDIDTPNDYTKIIEK